MKTHLLSLTFLLFSIFSIAQSSYDEAIKMGDRAFQKEQYRQAINYYFAAEAFDPTKKAVVKKKISTVFDKIEQLKNTAIIAERNAKKAIEAQQIARQREQEAQYQSYLARLKADSINERNQKLIDAFYFYDDKFALSVNSVKVGNKTERRYGFINRDAEVIIPYVYQQASLFDETTGFSKAAIKGRNILLDTMGREYEVAYKIEDLNQFTEALDLRKEPLDSFPSEVLNFPKLKVLILNRPSNTNKQITIPKGIRRLKNLTHLYLNNCLISTLPKEIGELKKLERLSANSCELKNLPYEIGNLENLKILHLSSNRLKGLPTTIGTLKALEILDLSSCSLRQLPEEIKQLQNLKYLELRRSNFKNFPMPVTYLSSLKYLGLEVSYLDTIPKEISQLKQLEVLKLGENRIKTLPKEIGQLRELKKINASNNKISAIPLEIGQLKNLQEFNIQFNQVKEIPSAFFNLKNLKILILDYNELKEIAPEIGHLESLEILEIGHNEISKLPNEIGQLKQLKELQMVVNQLTSVPDTFEALNDSLLILELRYNQFSDAEKARIKAMFPLSCKVNL